MAKRGRGRPPGSKNKPKMGSTSGEAISQAMLTRIVNEAVTKALANVKVTVTLKMNQPRGRKPKA